MVPASTVAHWDYLTGNVLAASDAFLSVPAARENLVAAQSAPCVYHLERPTS